MFSHHKDLMHIYPLVLLNILQLDSTSGRAVK